MHPSRLTHVRSVVSTRFAPLLVLPLLVLLSACSQAAQAAAAPTPTPTPVKTSLPAVLPLLQQSLQASLKVSSFRFDLSGKGTVQTGGPLLPALAKKTPYALHASGVVSLANHEGQLRFRLTVRPPQATALTFTGSALLVGNQLYLMAPSPGKWFVLDLTSIPRILMGGAGLQLQPQQLVALARLVTVVDHGVVTANGLRLHHLTFSVGKGVLGQLAATATSPAVKQALQSIQLPNGISIDLYIDTATFLPHRLDINGSLQVNVDALLTAIGVEKTPPAQGTPPRTISVSFHLSLTLSKFNRPVKKIIPPANAVPIQFGTLPPTT